MQGTVLGAKDSTENRPDPELGFSALGNRSEPVLASSYSVMVRKVWWKVLGIPETRPACGGQEGLPGNNHFGANLEVK